MTVGELIAFLEGLDKDVLVVLQSDAEGNGYSPLAGVDGYKNVYVEDSSWSGRVRIAELDADLEELGYTEDDVYDGEDGQPCAVLWPVN